jgi:hypothetical protein
MTPTVLFTPQYGAETTTNSGTELNDSPGTNVYMIYWGSYWSTSAGSAMATNIQNSVNNILYFSAYLDGLHQYGVPYRAYAPAIPTNHVFNYSDPSNGFHASDIQNTILDAIYNKGLPEADTYSNRSIYFVLTPPGVNSDVAGAGAYHTWFTDNHFPLDGDTTIYGWLGGSSLDDRTYYLTHETAEAMSDPFPYTGIKTTHGISWTGGGDFEICDAEAQNYWYRVNGYVAQSYWSQANGAYRVEDGNSQSVTVNNGNLIVNGDQGGVHNDVITLDVSGNGVRVTENGEVFQFDPGWISSITVNTGAGTDTVNVLRTITPVNINYNGGGGTDVANLGNPTHGVQDIGGPVTIQNFGGRTKLVVDNTGDGSAHLTAKQVLPGNGFDYITGLAPADIAYRGSQTGAVNIILGSGANTFTVENTNTFADGNATTLDTGTGNAANIVNVLRTTSPLNAVGHGPNTTVNAGNPTHGVQDIQAAVNLQNFGGRTKLVVDNTGDASAHLTARQVLPGNGFDYITGLAPADIAYRGVQTGAVNIILGSGANTFTVENTNTAGSGDATTLDTGTGIAVNIVKVLGANPTTPLTVVGHGPNTTLIGPITPSGWNITGTNAGRLTFGANTVTFTAVQNLTGGSGNDAFVLADGAGVDGNISDNNGNANTLDYSAYSTPVTVDLSAGTATGVGGSVSNILTLRGGAGDDSLTGNAAGGTTIFFASPGTDTITGLGTGNFLYSADANGTANTTWNVTAQNSGILTFPGATTTFSGMQNLYAAGSGSATFIFADGAGVDGNIQGSGGVNTLNESSYTTPVTVNLAAGTATGVGGNVFNVQTFVGSAAGGNTLTGPNVPTTWGLSATDAGTLSGGFSFVNFGNLTGGSAADSFVFADGAAVSGNIDGGGGTNKLDYSAYSTTVVVDLQTGSATGVGGTVAHIRDVTGGSGGGAGVYNILVGNGGNVLTGGDGRRNLLIAGTTPSTLIGGNQDDILIGGTTAYDQEAGLTSLNAIMAYWSGTADDYQTRVANLLSGNGVPLLDATKVTNNGGGNTLTGHHGGAGELNLYYGLAPALETTDYNPVLGEQFINC